jgi:hypothetical protein
MIRAGDTGPLPASSAASRSPTRAVCTVRRRSARSPAGSPTRSEAPQAASPRPVHRHHASTRPPSPRSAGLKEGEDASTRQAEPLGLPEVGSSDEARQPRSRVVRPAADRRIVTRSPPRAAPRPWQPRCCQPCRWRPSRAKHFFLGVFEPSSSVHLPRKIPPGSAPTSQPSRIPVVTFVWEAGSSFHAISAMCVSMWRPKDEAWV